MADRNIPGDGRINLNGSLLDRMVYTGNGSTEEKPEDQNLWPRPLARKWILMLFWGTCLLYCARMAMPICAVSMAATYQWSKVDTGLVLGGFFWGYCLTQILGGHASDKMGGERVLFLSAASWTLVTAGTPLLSRLGSHTLALMTLARFLMGLLQGVFFPALASLCSQRVTEGERGLLMSTMNSGSNLGMLLAGGPGSLMLDRYGWESVFYSTGFLSGLWVLVVWQCFLKGTNGSTILPAEKPPKAVDNPLVDFLLVLPSGNVAPEQMEARENSQWTMSRKRWLSLFKKPSVWAMVFAHMCICSTTYTLMSWLPTYFKESFPHAMGWVYNVVPWLAAIPSALGGGYISDSLINKGYDVASVRKIMQFVAMGVSSGFIILLSRCNKFPSAVVFVSAAISVSTFTSSGVSVNVQDLTPSCAGALYGFMSTFAAFMGVVMVSVSGYLIEVTLSWTTVFSVIVLVNAMGLGVFLIFGDARRVDLEDQGQIIVV